MSCPPPVFPGPQDPALGQARVRMPLPQSWGRAGGFALLCTAVGQFCVPANTATSQQCEVHPHARLCMSLEIYVLIARCID